MASDWPLSFLTCCCSIPKREDDLLLRKGGHASIPPGNEREGVDLINEPGIAAVARSKDEVNRITFLDRFLVDMNASGLLGEGTFSVCRRGTVIPTGEVVAIKIYRTGPFKNIGKVDEENAEDGFYKQVSVLQLMQKRDESQPQGDASGAALSKAPALESREGDFFIRLLDFSKSYDGLPGPDPKTEAFYAVMEYAECSLRSFMDTRKAKEQLLSIAEIWSLARSLILSVAGLHARGFVHLDLKPENMMIARGRLKLIDLDGCVLAGEDVCLEDTAVSFSPCYCSPEWARSLMYCWSQSPQSGKVRRTNIEIEKSLDVWSVGMILCELVTLSTINQQKLDSFMKNGHGREGALLYLEWLAHIQEAPVPEDVTRLDARFAEFVRKWILVCEPSARCSLAKCLSHPEISSASEVLPRIEGGPATSSRPPENADAKRSSIVLDADELAMIKERFSERQLSPHDADTSEMAAIHDRYVDRKLPA